jgi:lysyl-tRNA synthetase class 2
MLAGKSAAEPRAATDRVKPTDDGGVSSAGAGSGGSASGGGGGGASGGGRGSGTVSGATSERLLRWRARVRPVAVWYCYLIGALSILSALSERINNLLVSIPDNYYLALWYLIGIPSLGFGTLMLLLAVALRRRKRSACLLLILVLFFTGPIGTYTLDLILVGPSHVVSIDQIEPIVLLPTIMQVVAIAVLIWAYREFPAKGDPNNPRFALVMFTLLLASSAVLGTTLVAAVDANPSPSLKDHLLYTLQRGLAGTGMWYSTSGVDVPHWTNVLLNFLGSALLVLTVYAFFRPRRGVELLGEADERRLRELLDKHGGEDSLGYFALRRDKAVIFSPTGKSAIGYRVVGGVSLAGGDPIGDIEAWPGAIEAWLAEAAAHAWTPAVMGASERAGTVYARYGLDALELGDEAIVEVADFTLEGRAMRVVRQAYNRVERAGYTTRVRRHADISTAEMRDLIKLADRWREGTTERGFSMALGRLGDPTDGDCLMVECLDANGSPRALLSFVPWGRNGLSLDLMRRQRDTENGLIEFMVIQVLKQAKEFEVERVSLNFAMFRSVFERGSRLGAGPFLRMWRRVLIFFSRWWQIESLYRANAKYRPSWEPRYVCFPGARDLLRVGVAMARAEGFLTVPKPPWLRRLIRRLHLRKAIKGIRWALR